MPLAGPARREVSHRSRHLCPCVESHPNVRASLLVSSVPQQLTAEHAGRPLCWAPTLLHGHLEKELQSRVSRGVRCLPTRAPGIDPKRHPLCQGGRLGGSPPRDLGVGTEALARKTPRDVRFVMLSEPVSTFAFCPGPHQLRSRYWQQTWPWGSVRPGSARRDRVAAAPSSSPTRGRLAKRGHGGAPRQGCHPGHLSSDSDQGHLVLRPHHYHTCPDP